jgi:formiminotetrahydrofolate cyclodeaminase
MQDSIWDGTLEHIRDRLASLEPVPAGVSAAAVSATMGLGLLVKVLLIAAKRKDFAGDGELASSLVNDARAQSQTLSRLTDEDITAFHQYLDCLRKKQPTGGALRRAIEVPLNVARAAASGVDLCQRAEGLVHAFVASDLGAASILLRAAVRAALLTVDCNVRQLPAGDSYRNAVAAEALRLEATIARPEVPLRAR